MIKRFILRKTGNEYVQKLEDNIKSKDAEIEFLKPVFPNEKVTVISEKVYFRFIYDICNSINFSCDIDARNQL